MNASDTTFDDAIGEAPHIKYYEGYVRGPLTTDEWRCDYRVVETAGFAGRIRHPNARVSTRASFVVEDGRPGVQRA